MAKTDKALQAGDLDRLLDILIKDTHKNGMGEEVGFSDSPFAMGVPCQHVNISGSEGPVENRETAVSTDQFVIRYRADLNAKMSLLYEGETYDIIKISEVNNTRKQWTQITAKKHD